MCCFFGVQGYVKKSLPEVTTSREINSLASGSIPLRSTRKCLEQN